MLQNKTKLWGTLYVGCFIDTKDNFIFADSVAYDSVNYIDRALFV